MNKDLLFELDNYWKNFRQEDTDFIYDSDESSIVYTYGSTPFETFNNVINQVKKPKRFVVLGSSIGWQCFFWNSLFPDIPVIGYEIHDFRFDFSCYLADKYNIENIYLVNDTLTNVDIMDGDLIWENNLCIDEDMIDDFNWKVLTRNKEIQIVSYLPILSEHKDSNNNLILMDVNNNLNQYNQKVFEYPVSWTDKQTFYIL